MRSVHFSSRLAFSAVVVAATVAFVPPAAASSCQGKTVTISGTSGADELIGTAGADVIAGNDGNDVIKGGDGNDTICAGGGNDGVHGGQGNDAIQGGTGADLLVAGGDTDTLYGGDNAGGVHTDTELDYLAGGINPTPGEDLLLGSPGDELHLDKRTPTQATACPPAFAWHFGAYGGANRLKPNDPVPLVCATVTGTVTGWTKPALNDGDGKFKIFANEQWYGIEFMPRDKGALPDLGYREGLPVRVLGAWVTDSHGNNEIHPVFAVDVNNDGVWDSFSGPENAGSPHTLNPGGLDTTKRFCWHEGGNVCSPWSPDGRAFN